MTTALDDGRAGSRLDEEPLIRSAMSVVRPTLAIARRNRHRCHLPVAVADHHLESRAEP
jgi:hypothetical protein